MEVRRLTLRDWAVLRDVRLRALTAATDAFGNRHADETKFEDHHWKRLCASAAWWAVVRDERVIGLAAGLRRVEALDEPELFAVWVDPDARRRGAGSLLVRAATDWASASRASSMTIWVPADDAAARRLVAQQGFEPTGECLRLPHRGLIIERMRIVLTTTPLPGRH
jgi:GNAT superfamily N-acetyltransferase